MIIDNYIEFLKKYDNQYVKITKKESIIYGMLDGMELAGDSDSGYNEIDIIPVNTEHIAYCVKDKDIISIEFSDEETCKKYNEPISNINN